MRARKYLSDIGLVYCSAIWGSTFFIVKGSLDDVAPTTLLAFRFLLAAAGMLIWIVSTRRNPFAGWQRGILLGTVLWALYVPQTVGLLFTSAADSGFITGLFVAFLPPLYFLFFRQIPPFQRQIAVFIALTGLWFLTGGLGDFSIGHGITLIGAFFYAMHILVADRYVKSGSDPVVLSFQQFFIVGAFSFVIAPLLNESYTVTGTEAWVIIVFLALFPTLLAFVIQLYAQRISGPVKVGLIFALEPLFSAVFAWTLGGESFDWMQMTGGFLIVAAIILSELPIRKRPESNADQEAVP